LILKNHFITKGFTSTQFKNPCFLGDFFPKIPKEKAFLGVAALICFFSFWQNVTPKKMASQESGEVFFKGIFFYVA
jgi:hypothetical protein